MRVLLGVLLLAAPNVGGLLALWLGLGVVGCVAGCWLSAGAYVWLLKRYGVIK